MGSSWSPARPILLVALLLSLATHTRTQTTYDGFLDEIEGVLNGSTPVGKIDSMLFTQANQYNLYLSNKAGTKSVSRSASLPSAASTTAAGSGGNGGSSSSGGSSSNLGPFLRFILVLLGVAKSDSPSLAFIRSSVQWLSSNATVSKSNLAKLNMVLKLLKQPSLSKALGSMQSAFFIPVGAKVSLEAQGITQLSAAQSAVPIAAPSNSGQVSGQNYAQGYGQSGGAVVVQSDDGDDDSSSRHGGRQYRIESDDDDEEDDDEPECVEPTGRVRIFKYTSPQNVSFVILRAKSKCLADVRKVQIRNAPYGKTGALVMEIPGSWVLWDDDEIELVKHTFIANASSVTVSNGQTMDEAVISMTKAPWNYYAIFTTGSKKSGAMRGQFWKPFCPWCANFTFTGS